jgi:hypothetical protein
LVWLLLYAHRHRKILRAAGHILLIPANQLLVMGLKIWSRSNPNQRPFYNWPKALTNCTNRAHKNAIEEELYCLTEIADSFI